MDILRLSYFCDLQPWRLPGRFLASDALGRFLQACGPTHPDFFRSMSSGLGGSQAGLRFGASLTSVLPDSLGAVTFDDFRRFRLLG